MYSLSKLAKFSLLFTFSFTTLLSASPERDCCRKKCEVLYLDDFSLPIIEDPEEPSNAFLQASNWVVPPFTVGRVEYTEESFARGEGVYTLFNKGISLFPNAIQIVGNYKALSNSFAIKKGETQRYKAEIALTLDVTDIPAEWIPYLYPGGIDVDPRPADCGFILTFIVPEENDTVFTAVTGCFFFASNAVWAYHDMSQTNKNLEIVGDRPFFSHAKLVAEFDTSKKHAYEIEYHRGCNPEDSYIRWYVDGKLVRTQTNLGFIPEREKNDLFDSIALNVPCGQQLETRLDPALAQMLIETGQQQHALQAIVGSPCEKGLAPSIPVPLSAYCFPTSFVTSEPPVPVVHVESSLSIYRLEVKRRFH